MGIIGNFRGVNNRWENRNNPPKPSDHGLAVLLTLCYDNATLYGVMAQSHIVRYVQVNGDGFTHNLRASEIISHTLLYLHKVYAAIVLEQCTVNYTQYL